MKDEVEGGSRTEVQREGGGGGGLGTRRYISLMCTHRSEDTVLATVSRSSLVTVSGTRFVLGNLVIVVIFSFLFFQRISNKLSSFPDHVYHARLIGLGHSRAQR